MYCENSIEVVVQGWLNHLTGLTGYNIWRAKQAVAHREGVTTNPRLWVALEAKLEELRSEITFSGIICCLIQSRLDAET